MFRYVNPNKAYAEQFRADKRKEANEKGREQSAQTQAEKVDENLFFCFFRIWLSKS